MRALLNRRTEMALLILTAIILAAMLVNLELSQGNALTSEVLILIIGYTAAFTIAHLVLCVTAPHADQVLLPVAALLNGVGLVMVYRLDVANATTMAPRQLMWTVISLIMLLGTLVLLRDHRTMSRYAYLLGLVGLVLLASPLPFPPPDGADARIWITIGGFSVQPGEFAKVLLLIFFAQLLVNKRALFTVAGYRFLGLVFPRLRDLAPILAVWAVAILIMAISNDFGPALLLFTTVLGMLYLSTGRVSWLLIGAVLVAVGGTAVYMISDKIQERIANSLDPIANYSVTGYQPSQALFGMSWGGITGSGIGQGYPDIVPVAHSDYILAAVGEELGLIGLTAVIVLFAVFVTRGFRIALQVRDSFGKLVAAGMGLMMLIQLFLVVGGITTILPMTGLTTPFMSAGGSSLMANYILMAILLRISDSAATPPQGRTVPAR